MAPASHAASKGGKKSKAKGLGIDFKKVKTKVGRKLPPPKNATKLEFKSKAIVLPGQTLAQDKEGVAVNQRRQTLKELLTQTTHYSERIRKEALMGIKDLLAQFPKELGLHAVAIIEKLSPRITDSDKAVRQAFLLILRTSILPGLPQAMMGPLVPGLMAHVSSAMTHLVMDIRASACSFLDLLVQHYPSLVVSSFSGQIIQHYIDLLGKGGVSGQAMGRLEDVLSSLVKFLAALHIGLSGEPSKNHNSVTQTHHWGQKYTLTKKEEGRELQALHGYKSGVPEGVLSFQSSQAEAILHLQPTLEPHVKDAGEAQQKRLTSKRVQNTGNLGRTISVAGPLVPVLLECWAECAPTVCAGPMPDCINLNCMIYVTRALSLLFQCFISEAPPVSSAWDGSRKMATLTGSNLFEFVEEEWGLRLWMRWQFLPALQKHVIACFPVVAPSIHLPAKVEEGLVALNVGICEVMLHLIVPPSLEIGKEKEQAVTYLTLEYLESALNGMMLPSSVMSAGVVDSQLAEPHMRLLVSLVPRLLLCVSQEWTFRLLQAFSHVFQSCKAHSSTKLACLSAMANMLLPRSNQGQVEVPLQFQKQWLQSLPRLLWELKHTHPSFSQAILQMLLHIGRSAPQGSLLAQEYAVLQPAMIPFFCTFLASTKNVRCVYGPFIKLPKKCQELAVDTLYYCTHFSTAFLKAVAHCCLCAEVGLDISIRIVEVLHRVFTQGFLGFAQHISFLLTLLVGHTSTQAGGVQREEMPQYNLEIRNDNGIEDLKEESRRRQCVIAGVVCACLVQMGDCKLVLHLLGPSIHQELVKSPPLGTVHCFLRAIAVLSSNYKRSSSSFLPESLEDTLPQFVAHFLFSVAMVEGLQSEALPEGDSVWKNLHKPCLVLLSRSPRFARAVLSCLHSLLLQDMESSSSMTLKQMCGVTRAILEISKHDNLGHVLSSSEDTFKAVLQTLKGSQQLEDRSDKWKDLQRLCDQLESTAGTLYGWRIENIQGGTRLQPSV